jgi:primase-polymerase (primpol)-like protein
MEQEFMNIPPDLIALDQWVLWRTEIRDGKPTKVPKNPRTGFNASTIDPETWGTFDVVKAAYENGNYDGIGFVFTGSDPYCGIDLDKCRDQATGKIDPGAQWIIENIDSYTEVSPSETGVKIFAVGELPNRKKGNIEAYSSKRFFTMTGHHLPETPKTPQDRNDILIQFAREHFPSPPEKSPSRGTYTGTEAEVIHKARNAKNGDRFNQLWNGNWQKDYPSQSEADLALCAALMFWTGNDADMVDSLFRKSGLMREKWDESRGEHTYGEKTLERAQGTSTSFCVYGVNTENVDFSEVSEEERGFTEKSNCRHVNSVNRSQHQESQESGSMIVAMDLIREWVDRASGIFENRQVCYELDIYGAADKRKVSVYLKRLADEGLIRRHGKRHGVWRKLDDGSDNVIDFKNVEVGPGVNMWLPFGLHKMVRIHPGNVIVVAGEINSGKTAFTLNTARYNMHSHTVFYLSSEMEGEEFRDRLDAFEGLGVHDWQISAHRVAENYEDHIRPGRGVINIVDFLEIHDEFFRIGGQLKNIHDALDGAVAVVAVQKNPDKDTPLGGYRGLEVARLALAIEEEGVLKITKAKAPRGKHTPRNKQIRFMVAGSGSRLVPLGDWHEQSERKAYPKN